MCRAEIVLAAKWNRRTKHMYSRASVVGILAFSLIFPCIYANIFSRPETVGNLLVNGDGDEKQSPRIGKPILSLPFRARKKASIPYSSVAILLRGGQVISGKKKKSLLKVVKEQLEQVRPATRIFLLLSLFCTLVHITGLPAPALFGLDISRIYEIWRPFTSMAYLGAPSMSMANSLYFLIRYGQTLETTNGTGDHAWFLLVQTFILSCLGLLLGFPSQAQAMIAAAVYVSSRMNPMEKMGFQFGLVITSWQLPFAMMTIDCLSQQNLAAAWPHVLGIFSGHVYHFFTRVWPALGGKGWLLPPKWFVKRLGGKPSSNISGVVRTSKSEEQRASKKGVMKKVGKARKLAE